MTRLVICRAETAVLLLINFQVLLSTSSEVPLDHPDYNSYCPNKNPCKDPSKHLVCLNKDQVNECKHLNHNRHFKYYKYNKTSHSVAGVLNEYRREVASGRATGAPDKNGKPTPLPRAYGMRLLKWDRELAKLANLLAKRCREEHDFTCAATNMFPNLIPWYFLDTEVTDNTTTRMYFASFKRGVQAILRASRNTLLPKHITNCPRLDVQTAERDTHYLKIVQDGATHIGCAVAIDTTDLNATFITNYYHHRCYISYKTPPGQPVYNTTRPTHGSGFSFKCGCHPFYREEEQGGCLCVEYRPTSDSTPAFFYQPVYLNKTVRGPPEFDSRFCEDARVVN